MLSSFIFLTCVEPALNSSVEGLIRFGFEIDGDGDEERNFSFRFGGACRVPPVESSKLFVRDADGLD